MIPKILLFSQLNIITQQLRVTQVIDLVPQNQALKFAKTAPMIIMKNFAIKLRRQHGPQITKI
jgi:hypothetical protein